MKDLKRSTDNIVHDDSDKFKRKKVNDVIDRYPTVFEDLSNEIIYEIFDYLHFHHAFQVFYDLNKRFQNLFIHSNLPIKVNISSMSKSNFHHYFKSIVEPQCNRIQSFRISMPFATNVSSLLLPLMKNFTRLERLIINDIESEYIEEIVDHLSSLPVLTSLTLVAIDKAHISNETYRRIFRLSTLKYLQIGMTTESYFFELPIAKYQFSSIEHLVINSEIGLEYLSILLSYVPKLRHLSVNNLNGNGSNWMQRSSMQLHSINHVSLKLNYVKLMHFQSLIINCFRYISQLVIHHTCYHIDYVEYLNADAWEWLIKTHMPNLQMFDCHFVLSSWYSKIDHQIYDTRIQKFNTMFWTAHQWFFDYYYYNERGGAYLIFFSTNPYRRKTYILYEKPNESIDAQRIRTNMDSVQHLHIDSGNAIKQFVGSFPNATELTISNKFDTVHTSILTDLDRIVSLKQLTKLTLVRLRVRFEQLLELLPFTPNLTTMKLNVVLLYQSNPITIQQTDIFELISSKNIVSNLTVEQEITLNEFQLLTTLFPRLTSLTINMNKEQLEIIIRSLLAKENNNMHYLSTLCITKHHSDFFKNLEHLIHSENLLTDYTLKYINKKVYLWW